MKISTRGFGGGSRIKWAVAAFLVTGMWGGFHAPRQASAYVMPAEQLVGLMAAKFSSFKTLVITQSTELMDSGSNESVMAFREEVWVKPPHLCGSRILADVEEGGMSQDEIQAVRFGIDSGYRQLLIANNPRDLLDRLSEWGIDQTSVALTRLDGTIAYCIGDTSATGPRLLVEKRRFLPLLVSYRAVDDPHKLITVRFEDYQALGNGWYPYRIEYFLDGELMERYVLLDAQVNVPLPSGRTHKPETGPVSSSGDRQLAAPSFQKDIHGLIETFKQKYHKTSE